MELSPHPPDQGVQSPLDQLQWTGRSTAALDGPRAWDDLVLTFLGGAFRFAQKLFHQGARPELVALSHVE